MQQIVFWPWAQNEMERFGDNIDWTAPFDAKETLSLPSCVSACNIHVIVWQMETESVKSELWI